jgi:hypothetical protein
MLNTYVQIMASVGEEKKTTHFYRKCAGVIYRTGGPGRGTFSVKMGGFQQVYFIHILLIFYP